MKVASFLTVSFYCLYSLIAYEEYQPDSPPNFVTWVDFDLTDPPDFIV